LPADFRETDPSKIAVGFGGTSPGAGFVLLAVIGSMRPAHFGCDQPDESRPGGLAG